MAATNAARPKSRVLDLRPKGALTPERIEEELAKLDEFRVGQIIEVKPNPKAKKIFKAKVLKTDEDSGEMTVRILNPLRPARILPSQADGSIDRLVDRSPASRRQHVKH